MGAKLDTKISRGLSSSQMVENVKKMLGRQAGDVATVDQSKAMKTIESAKQVVKKGNEALGAKLNTNVSRGLSSSQMVENATKIAKTNIKTAGTDKNMINQAAKGPSFELAGNLKNIQKPHTGGGQRSQLVNAVV